MKNVYDIIVEKEVAVTNEDRIYLPWTGQYFEIRRYSNPQRIDELPVILAELMP
jgi:hypothetical protein